MEVFGQRSRDLICDSVLNAGTNQLVRQLLRLAIIDVALPLKAVRVRIEINAKACSGAFRFRVYQ